MNQMGGLRESRRFAHMAYRIVTDSNEAVIPGHASLNFPCAYGKKMITELTSWDLLNW